MFPNKFFSMSDHKNDTNSLLSTLRPVNLQAIKKLLLSQSKKNLIWGVTRPSPKVSFTSSKLYSYFIFSIFFLFNTSSFTQSSCMISLALVDKTSNNRSPSSIFGGSFGESHLMHCLYFQLLSLVFLWQFY